MAVETSQSLQQLHHLLQQLEDAENLDHVAANVVNAAFWNMGENCSADSRLIVHQAVTAPRRPRRRCHRATPRSGLMRQGMQRVCNILIVVCNTIDIVVGFF